MKRKYTKQAGSSLIEVMVSLFVLAIGLLGVLAVQTESLKTNKNAYLFSQAAFLANDIFEGMRASPSSPDSYRIAFADTPSQPNCTGATADCSATQIANWNLFNWRQNVAAALPEGRGQITKTGDYYKIEIEFLSGYDKDNNKITEKYELVTGL